MSLHHAAAKAATAASASALPSSLHILGSGSIGILFASSIRRSLPNYPVTVLLRSGRGHEDRLCKPKRSDGTNSGTGSTSSGSCLVASVGKPPTPHNGPSSSYKIELPAEIITPPSSPSSLQQKLAVSSSQSPLPPIQNLVLCTKAPDAAEALSSVLHRLDRTAASGDGANVIILSNGAFAIRDELMEVLDRTKGRALARPKDQAGGGGHDTSSFKDGKRQEEKLGNVNLVLASTTHGAYREVVSDAEKVYSIIHAGVGSTYVESRPMANLFDAAGLNASYATPTEMYVLLWKKLATNCAINPLTALNRCKNGELFENDGNITTMDEIVREVSAVAIKEAKTRGDELLSDVIDALGYEPLRAFVDTVIRDTADNTSSMLQDVLVQRHTEVGWLNGYVVRVGKERHGLLCPYNEDLCNRVEDLYPMHGDCCR